MLEIAAIDLDGEATARPVACARRPDRAPHRHARRPARRRRGRPARRRPARRGSRTASYEARVIRLLCRHDRARARRLPPPRRRRPHRADRPPHQDRVPRRARRYARRRRRRARPRRGAAGAPRSACRRRGSSSGSATSANPRTISLIAIHEQRHPDRVSRRGDRPGRGGKAGDARRAHRSAPASRWSPSTAPTRAISTMRSGPSPTPIPTIAAAGTSWSRSPTSPGMCGPATRSTAPPRSAATRSISPTASCRCCPRRCRTSCAR